MHLNAERARRTLRYLRDGGGRVLVELVGRDERNSAGNNLDALAVLVFLLADLDARPPRHGLADVGKGNRRQFPQDALEADFAPLRSATDDLLDSGTPPIAAAPGSLRPDGGDRSEAPFRSAAPAALRDSKTAVISSSRLYPKSGRLETECESGGFNVAQLEHGIGAADIGQKRQPTETARFSGT
jgi:hypothetical protein